MAGIGEITAIFGAVQVGYSIATTLITYIGDVRDAEDDVRDLAISLRSTLIHLDQLTRYATTERRISNWPAGQELISNCQQHSERVVDKLSSLLKITGQPQGDTFKREDIDLSPLRKAAWPTQRRDVQLVKQELHALTSEILLGIVLCQSRVDGKQDRQKLTRSLGALNRVRSRDKEKLQQTIRQSEMIAREPQVHFEEPETDNDEELITLLNELRAEAREEEDNRRAELARNAQETEERETQLKVSAVADYERSLQDTVEKYQKEVRDMTSALSDCFDNVQHSKIHDFVQTHIKLPSVLAELTTFQEQRHVPQAVEPSKPKRWRTSKHSPSALLKSQIIPDQARITALLVKVNDREGNVERIHPPMHWLVDAMRREEHPRRGLSKTMVAWNKLPMSMHGAVHNYLIYLAHPGPASLIFARCPGHKPDGKKRRFWHRRDPLQAVEARLKALEADYDHPSPEEPQMVVLLVYRHGRAEFSGSATRPSAPALFDSRDNRSAPSTDRASAELYEHAGRASVSRSRTVQETSRPGAQYRGPTYAWNGSSWDLRHPQRRRSTYDDDLPRWNAAREDSRDLYRGRDELYEERDVEGRPTRSEQQRTQNLPRQEERNPEHQAKVEAWRQHQLRRSMTASPERLTQRPPPVKRNEKGKIKSHLHLRNATDIEREKEFLAQLEAKQVSAKIAESMLALRRRSKSRKRSSIDLDTGLKDQGQGGARGESSQRSKSHEEQELIQKVLDRQDEMSGERLLRQYGIDSEPTVENTMAIGSSTRQDGSGEQNPTTPLSQGAVAEEDTHVVASPPPRATVEEAEAFSTDNEA